MQDIFGPEFSSSFYKDLIDKEEGLTPNADYEEISDTIQEAEVISSDADPKPSIEDDPFMEEELHAHKIVDGVRKTGSIKNTVNRSLVTRDDNAKNPPDVAKVFSDLFKDLNDTYGLDIRFDFNSFSNTLSYLIKPKSQAAVEVYISEAYSRVRASLYIMYLNAITMLSTQILDPKFIQSNSMSYSDKLVLMRELFQYIQSLNSIYKEVKVKDSDLKLKKLAESDNQENSLETDDVQNFLENLANMVKSKPKE